MSKYISGTFFGLSLGVCLASATMIGMDLANFPEKTYAQQPGVYDAVLYHVSSIHLEEVVDEMNNKFIESEDNVAIMLNKPDNGGINEDLKSIIQGIANIKNSAEYAQEVYDFYTDIETLDKRYDSLTDSLNIQEYAKDYFEIKDSIDDLSEDLSREANTLEPNVEYIHNKISNFNIWARSLISGLVVTLISTPILGHVFAKDREYDSYTSRKRNKP